jgi:hypothetical protein
MRDDDIRSEVAVNADAPLRGRNRSPITSVRAMVTTTAHLCRLRNSDGAYLHMSTKGTTDRREWAWVGSQSQLKRLRAKGDYSAFKAVAVE